MRPIPLTPEQQDCAKVMLLRQLAATGKYNAIELGGLAARHLDDTLDEVFRFTDAVRLRVADDRFVTIFPGTTLQ